MTKRYLRPWLANPLKIATIFLFVMLGSIDDFEMSAIPYIIGGVAILAFNLYILEKYTKH